MTSKLKQIMTATLEGSRGPIPEAYLKGGEESMEAGLIALREAMEESDSTGSIVAELNSIAVGLEGLCSYLATLEGSTGLRVQELPALRLAVEAYSSRLGVSEDILPSVEDRLLEDDTEALARESRAALETLLSQVWVATRQSLVESMEKTEAFLEQAFNNLDAIVERATALRISANELTDDTSPKEITIRNADRVVYSGKLDAEAVEEGLDRLREVLEVLYSDYLKALTGYWGELHDEVERQQSSDAADSEAFAEAEKCLMTVLQAVELKPFAGDLMLNPNDAGTIVHGNGEGVEFRVPALTKAEANVVQDSVTEITAYQREGLLHVTQEVIKICEVLQRQGELLKELKDYQTTAIKRMNATPADSAGKTLKYLIAHYNNDAIKPLVSVTAHTVDVLCSVLFIVERSIKAYQ